MRRTLQAMTCIAMALTLTACGSDGEDSAGRESSPTTRVLHDPPLGVSDVPTFTWNGGDTPIAYSADGAGYAVTDGNIHKRDLSNGEVLWRTTIDGLTETSMAVGRELDDAWRRQPPLGTIAGEPSLAFTYRKVVEGTGTEGDIDEQRVAVVSVRTGALKWDVELPETGRIPRDDAEDRTVLIAGITDDSVVVANDWDADDAAGGTAVLDGADGSVLWERAGLIGSVAADGMVVARQEKRAFKLQAWVLGFSARTGKQVWATAKDGMMDVPYSAGAGLVQFQDMDKVAHNKLVDIKTGQEKAVVPGRCLYDEQSLLVCVGLGKELAAYRQESLEKLWSIKHSTDQGVRVMPNLITTWHGAVYASVGQATVVLDGTTGEDKVADLGVVPTAVVNGYIISVSRVLPASR